jgi:hypothetical protein
MFFFLLFIYYLIEIVKQKSTEEFCQSIHTSVDLVFVDQKCVGKRSLHLMDTVNAKQRWTTVYWHVNKFLRASIIFENLRHY